MRQLGEFGARRRLGPLEPDARSIGAIDVDTIQNEHVKVDIEVQRTSEPLDQRHGTGAAALREKPAFLIKCVAMQR